jgi:hypothetical protein
MNAALATLALRASRRAIEADLRSQGHKLYRYSAADLQRLARAYLQDHPEVFDDCQRKYASIIAPRP